MALCQVCRSRRAVITATTTQAKHTARELCQRCWEKCGYEEVRDKGLARFIEEQEEAAFLYG